MVWRTVAKKALGTTGASETVAMSMRLMRLTCSPSSMSPLSISLLRSSSVTPLTSRSSRIRLPSASACRYVFSLTSARAMLQLT